MQSADFYTNIEKSKKVGQEVKAKEYKLQRVKNIQNLLDDCYSII